jgi:cytochrome c551/c552
VITKMLPEPAAPRIIEENLSGAEIVYQGICAGCHAYNIRLIGPPTLTIQAQYGDNAETIAAYIANPEKKRPDFPTMPPQDHLSAPMRQLVAEYMLALTN